MSTEELAGALVPFGVAEADIKKMIQAADIDGDGVVSCARTTAAIASLDAIAISWRLL